MDSSKAGMSNKEREIRSRLAKLVSNKAFVRGTITMRRNICGNPNCKCAKGEKHLCVCISQSQKGKSKQLYIPLDLEKEAKELTKEYNEIKKLLESISKSAFVMFLTKMGSLNALEQHKGNGFWKYWTGKPLPSADTIGRVFSMIDAEPIREELHYVYDRLKRNKVLEPYTFGMNGLVIDGHESTSSYKRCCEGCLERKIKTEKGEEIQYYHKQVTAILLSRGMQILMDSETQRPGEDEVAAAIRLVKRVLKKYPRAFSVVIADGLYVRSNFFKIITDAGKEVIAVLKDERRELLQDAMDIFKLVKPEVVTEGSTRRECWDVEGFNSWKQFGKEVRVVRSLEKTVTKSQLTGEEEEKISDWVWVTTFKKEKCDTRGIIEFGHGRWRIENNGFNELVNKWKSDHVYKHAPKAIEAFYLLSMLACNLFNIFVERNIKPILRNKHTKRHWGRVMAADLYINKSVPFG